MATLNALLRARKQILAAFKAKARELQDSTDSMIRLLDRILKRRRNVPDVQDYINVVNNLKLVDIKLDDMTKSVAAGRTNFL